RMIQAHKQPIRSVTISSDGMLLATCAGEFIDEDADGPREPIKIWNTTTGELVRTFGAGDVVFHSVRFSPDGRCLAAARSGQAVIWAVSTDAELLRINHTGLTIHCIEFSQDGKLLAIAYSEPRSSIMLWDLEHDKELTVLSGHADSVNALAF